MKKNTLRPDWKLRLNRETLRSLEKSALERVVGGTRLQSDCSNCAPTHEPTCFC